MNHPFLITAQLHGTVKLFLDLRESRLWIGGGAVGDVGLTNILNDTVQIIMDRVAKKVTFLYLSQLQRADIKVICKFYDLLKSDEQKNFRMQLIFNYPAGMAAAKMLVDMTVGMVVMFQIFRGIGG